MPSRHSNSNSRRKSNCLPSRHEKCRQHWGPPLVVLLTQKRDHKTSPRLMYWPVLQALLRLLVLVLLPQQQSACPAQPLCRRTTARPVLLPFPGMRLRLLHLLLLLKLRLLPTWPFLPLWVQLPRQTPTPRRLFRSSLRRTSRRFGRTSSGSSSFSTTSSSPRTSTRSARRRSSTPSQVRVLRRACCSNHNRHHNCSRPVHSAPAQTRTAPAAATTATARRQQQQRPTPLLAARPA